MCLSLKVQTLFIISIIYFFFDSSSVKFEQHIYFCIPQKQIRLDEFLKLYRTERSY